MARVCESCASSLEGSVLSQEGTVKNKGGVGFPCGPVLRTYASTLGGTGSIPVGERISQKPQGMAKTTTPRPTRPPGRETKADQGTLQESTANVAFFFLMITGVIMLLSSLL